MVKDWHSQGCAVCRALWEQGDHPPELAINLKLHARLHRCSHCGSYWRQEERYAVAVDEAEARRDFPEVLSKDAPP